MSRMWGGVLSLVAALGLVPPLAFAQVGVNPPGSQSSEKSRVVLLGFVQDGQTTRGILGWEGLVFLVREGDTILGTYRVERLGEDFVILRDGATRIRAAYRSSSAQQVQAGRQARLRPGPPNPEDEDAPPAPDDDSGDAIPPRMGAASGAPGAGEAVPAGQEENPFVRALRERAQVTPVPATPPDNPFVRALRERGAMAAPPQENPPQQSSQPNAPPPPAGR